MCLTFWLGMVRRLDSASESSRLDRVMFLFAVTTVLIVAVYIIWARKQTDGSTRPSRRVSLVLFLLAYVLGVFPLLGMMWTSGLPSGLISSLPNAILTRIAPTTPPTGPTTSITSPIAPAPGDGMPGQLHAELVNRLATLPKDVQARVLDSFFASRFLRVRDAWPVGCTPTCTLNMNEPLLTMLGPVEFEVLRNGTVLLSSATNAASHPFGIFPRDLSFTYEADPLPPGSPAATMPYAPIFATVEVRYRISGDAWTSRTVRLPAGTQQGWDNLANAENAARFQPLFLKSEIDLTLFPPASPTATATSFAAPTPHAMVRVPITLGSVTGEIGVRASWTYEGRVIATSVHRTDRVASKNALLIHLTASELAFEPGVSGSLRIDPAIGVTVLFQSDRRLAACNADATAILPVTARIAVPKDACETLAKYLESQQR